MGAPKKKKKKKKKIHSLSYRCISPRDTTKLDRIYFLPRKRIGIPVKIPPHVPLFLSSPLIILAGRRTASFHHHRHSTEMKPTQALLARLRLTTKQAGKGYYKGNRTGSMGYFDKSSYIIDYRKVRTYVVPEGLSDFRVCAFSI